MIKYTHGSEDSLDNDVYYVFDSLPSYRECQKFCSEDPDENRNIIVVNDGVVVDCFKGTPDEVNNGLFHTYSLHQQEHPLIINKLLERDVLIKSIRVVRCFLSHFSRTTYRDIVKSALKSYDWSFRLGVFSQLNLIGLENYGKNRNPKDILKTFAFQIGQNLQLFENNEIYTKKEANALYPRLRGFLYREPMTDMEPLQSNKDVLYYILKNIKFIQKDDYVIFPSYGKKINVKEESYGRL